MIPLRDSNPSRTVPFINYLLIGANILVFIIQIVLGGEKIIFRFGIIPVSVVSDIQAMNIGIGSVFPFFSSMFLHGGWMHLIGNMLFLYIFGDNVEDRLGHLKYLIFYLVCGIAAAAAQVFIFPQSGIPMVGASGAIAGVMGAYVLIFPTARVVTLIPVFFFFQVVELPAFLFLGIWFILQILSGMFSLGIGADAGGVAWWAHIGGFAAGVILLPFLKRR